MKKVGLITFHESNNYGTNLQAFALQESIKGFGYDCEIINYNRKKLKEEVKDSKFNKVRVLVNKYGITKIGKYLKYKNIYNNNLLAFSNFRKDYYNRSVKKYYCYEQLCEDQSEYDAFICGSDMIWSVDRSDNIDIYLLKFADKYKRISYAPSFGSNTIPVKMEKLYKDALCEFNSLSCREQSGVDIIKKLTKRKAQLVLDPTLILHSDKWLDFNTLIIEEDYILCYLFEGINENVKKLVEDVAKSMKCKIVTIPMSFDDIDKDYICPKVCGPKEFVSLFRGAKYVFTNSYHGMLFSIINNKPFSIFRRECDSKVASYETRIESLLDLLGLSDRFIDSSTIFTDKILSIDYSHANNILENERKLSLQYLKESLEKSLNEE